MQVRCGHIGPLALLCLACGGGTPPRDEPDAGPSPTCGDGRVDDGEECDLGASNDDAALCTTSCRIQFCGDGHVGAAERCDDGDEDDGDGCNTDCTESAPVVWTWTWDGAADADEIAHGVAVDGAGRVALVGSWDASRSGWPSAGIWLRIYDDEGLASWTRTEQGLLAGHDFGMGVAFDERAGGVVVVGSIFSGPERLADVWVRRYDDDGAELWTRTFDGPGHGRDVARRLVLDDEGAIYLAGTLGEGPSGGDDLWFAKLDADGALEWERTRDGGLRGGAGGIALVPGGDVVVAGWVGGDGQQVWLGRFDPEGEERWSVTRANARPGAIDLAADVAVDAEGNVFVAGGVHLPSIDEPGRAWVARYDGDGAEVWSHLVRNDGFQAASANAIAVDASGELSVVGRSPDPDTPWAGDVWIGRFDADGSELWAQTVGGPVGDFDYGEDVAVDAAGDVYASGAVSSESQELDGWLRRIVAWGPTRWSRTYDEAVRAPDRALGVTLTDEGDVITAGLTTAGPSSGFDGWIARLSGDGTERWMSTWDSGTLGDDEARAVVTSSEGLVYVAGTSDGGYGTGGSDALLRAYDDAGEELWTTLSRGDHGFWDAADAVATNERGTVVTAGYMDFGTTQGSLAWMGWFGEGGMPLHEWRLAGEEPARGSSLGTRATSVAVSSDGDTFACGQVMTGDATSTEWVRRFDDDGAETWSAAHLDELGPRASCEALAIDGELTTVFAAGWSDRAEPTGDPEEVWLAYQPLDPWAWVAAFTADGDPSWIRFDETRGAIESLASLPRGEVAAGGWSGAEDVLDSEERDVWVRRYDAMGQPLWTRTHAAPAGASDAVFAIAADAEGNVVVAGQESTDAAAGSNVWVRRYGP